MKKFLSLVAVMAVAVMASSTVWAASFTSTSKAARATFGVSDLVFEVNLKHWSGTGTYNAQTTATQINFDASDVTLGTTTVSGAISKDYALIHSNLSQQPANTIVYIYTNNKSNTTNFVAVSSGTNGYSGLVRKGQNATYVDGDYATIQTKCVQISSANVTYNTTNGPKDAEFLNDDQYNGDRWLEDKSTTGFTAANNIIGKGGVGGGIWQSSGDWGTTYSSEDIVMFFKANFHSVNGGDEYGTDTITFNISAE